MIEINLLPGARKKRGAGAGLKLPDIKQLAGLVKDPWLIACIGGWAVVAAVLVLLYLPKRNAVAELRPQVAAVKREERRLQAVLRTKAEAEARRESLTTQINVIRDIDRERYIWPHVMDAVARALPAYTWLDGITPRTGADTADGGASGVSLQLTGKSADIQAVTRFVRNLEDSPFLQGATTVQTGQTTEQGRDLYTFVLNVRYQQPDTTLLTMQPLAATMVRGVRSGGGRAR
jgi:Tfp pilus assembly protein PilN